MRILVISDTHGHENNLEKVLCKVKPIDMLIHCGDVEGGERFIRERAGALCACCFVRGNNDYFSDLPREAVFTIKGYKIMVTHGHNYGVSMDTSILREEARSRGIQIVMFGHTHRPFLEQRSDITVLNPGSLSYPRQAGRKPSYLIMEIKENGEIQYSQEYLEEW